MYCTLDTSGHIQIPGQPAAYCTMDTSGHYTDTRPTSCILHPGHIWSLYRYQAKQQHIASWTRLVILQIPGQRAAYCTLDTSGHYIGQPAAYCSLDISGNSTDTRPISCILHHGHIIQIPGQPAAYCTTDTSGYIIQIPGQPVAYCTLDTSGHYTDTRPTSCILHYGHILSLYRYQAN